MASHMDNSTVIKSREKKRCASVYATLFAAYFRAVICWLLIRVMITNVGCSLAVSVLRQSVSRLYNVAFTPGAVYLGLAPGAASCGVPG